MSNLFHPGRYRITIIADNADCLLDFRPYVASINDRGVVAFQATLRGGGSGVFCGEGGPLTTALDNAGGAGIEVCSHPDIDNQGLTCFYGRRGAESSVFLARPGVIHSIAPDAGPLGPTMNNRGMVAFRAERGAEDTGIFAGNAAGVATLAEVRDGFTAFHGLPVINERGAVAFRADLPDGQQAIYLSENSRRTEIVRTGQEFERLGHFPVLTDTGQVTFVAVLRQGLSGVFTASASGVAPLLDSSGPFESFRGALLDHSGRLVFYATPRGGTLGVFTGPDPAVHRLIAIGDDLFGAVLSEFALNPVSINSCGQLALRVLLHDDRQLILRADPPDVSAMAPAS